MTADPGFDERLLAHHGDRDVRPGALDFAVNVRGAAPPAWLAERLRARLADLAAYPSAEDELRARSAAAELHGVDAEEVLPLAGSAEGFALVARLARARGVTAAVVHPSFTEPELALRAEGVAVRRVLVAPGAPLDTAAVPADCDLVVVGNPTNPTSTVHPRATLAALCRPGRLTVVDEAFCDLLVDEPEVTLAGARLPGLLVLRSLTKSWALAGLRVGYAVGAPALLDELSRARPPWPVGTLQLEAITAVCGPRGQAELAGLRRTVAAELTEMTAALTAAGIEPVARPRAPFVLVRTPPGVDPVRFRERLAARGIAVRRGDTFPGLEPGCVRLAVRDRTMVSALLTAWQAAVDEFASEPSAEQSPEQTT